MTDSTAAPETSSSFRFGKYSNGLRFARTQRKVEAAQSRASGRSLMPRTISLFKCSCRFLWSCDSTGATVENMDLLVTFLRISIILMHSMQDTHRNLETRDRYLDTVLSCVSTAEPPFGKDQKSSVSTRLASCIRICVSSAGSTWVCMRLPMTFPSVSKPGLPQVSQSVHLKI